MTPLPPLSHLFGQAAGGGQPRAVRTWTTETVEAVFSDGTVQVRGHRIPTSGRAVLVAGDRVPVLWSLGQPAVVAQHSLRRSGGLVLTEEGYAVEELLLYEAATDQPAGARWDVYFRNDQQVTRLNLSGIINADRVPAEDWSFGSFGFNQTGVLKIGWGQADNMFWVMAQAVRTPIASPTPKYYPRFYVFRLSRPEGEPAGGATQTASLVATVVLPTFAMPDKYGFIAAPSTSPSPATFPDDLKESGVASSVLGYVSSQIVLQRDAQVVMIAPRRATNAYGTFSGLPLSEEVTYLVAVRSDAPVVIWESPITDAYRDPIPFSSVGGSVEGQAYIAYEVNLLGFAVLEWTATVKRVATSWEAKAVHDDNIAPRIMTTLVAKRGVFVEDGTVLPVQTIQPWTDFQFDARNGAETAYVESEPRRLIIHGSPTDGRVLLTGDRFTAVSPNVTESRIERWQGALTLLALEAVSTGALDQRVQALRLFDARTVYAVAEDSASSVAGAWPAIAERGRFTLLSGGLPLDLGKTLSNDGTHQGPLAPLPTGLADIDPVAEPRRLAYHVAGTIT